VSRQLAHVHDQNTLCHSTSRLIAETFDVLSVSVWVCDDDDDRTLVLRSSTTHRDTGGSGRVAVGVPPELEQQTGPFNLDSVGNERVQVLRDRNPSTFPNGGDRFCIPLRSGAQLLGVIVLADRVAGAPYTPEELALLACIADHATSVIANLRLSAEVARGRELEAFRTMSAFFVHDLKNAAATLNLTLKNLPIHFDDPAFRQDALRGIGNTARRIDEMIARLSAFRDRPADVRLNADLNYLVAEALDRVGYSPSLEVVRDLRPVPPISADPEQIQSVVTNLVMNARDALGNGGRIEVRTERQGERVVLSVADNGCGMSPTFVRDSLFRPFQSTKNKGLGIGLFQCRAIVHAHGGGMHVESAIGKGTRFMVTLPVSVQQ
jgi:putative PEP-CTERM system histidine kinase